MRTLRLIGMAIVAVIMCVNFTACSDDDDDEEQGGGTTGGKRLISVIWENKQEGYSDTEESKYEYDAQGRVSKETYTTSDGDYETRNYTYSDSKITVTTVWEGKVAETETYILNKGVVVKYTQESNGNIGLTTTYEYDNDNRLKSISRSINEEGAEQVIWENDNITKIEGSTYTYTDIPVSKGYNSYHNIDAMLYKQGYFGKCSAHLIKTETRYGETDTFAYEMEDDYVVKVISNVGSMKLTWK